MLGPGNNHHFHYLARFAGAPKGQGCLHHSANTGSSQKECGCPSRQELKYTRSPLTPPDHLPSIFPLPLGSQGLLRSMKKVAELFASALP